MMFFSLNKVKDGPKRPYYGPKREAMYEKRQKKMEFSDLKYLLFSGIGGYPAPPLIKRTKSAK